MSKMKIKVHEAFNDKEEMEWWSWIADNMARKVSFGSGHWDENCRMKVGSKNAYSLLALAKEFADMWNIGFRSYTNSLGSPFFEFTWDDADAARMQKGLHKSSESKKNEAYSDYDAIRDWLEGVMEKAGTMFDSTDVSENRPGEICAEIYGYDSTGGDATFSLVWRAGEDFAETISAMADELVDFADDFDPEEEAKMYSNSGLAGVPSLRQLLKAMDERKEDMVSFAGAVSLAASKL